MNYKIINGNNIDVLKTYPDNYFDSIVTDPPYGISFLGKEWDNNVGTLETYQQCLRVLKPGGHILAFSAARTYHHLAMVIEQAGFEIRDQIMWIYGSGFPKSQDVGKNNNMPEWNGWGTQLKPAHEPICTARKPLIGSVYKNVQEYGTGAINIDACRVVAEQQERFPANVIHDGSDEVTELFPYTISGGMKPEYGTKTENKIFDKTYPSGRDGVNGTFESNEGSASRFFKEIKVEGRFPANIIMDEQAGELLDEQAPSVGNMFNAKRTKDSNTGTGASLTRDKHEGEDNGIYDGLSGASKFFYCPKVSKKERGPDNNHPTVKPIELMKYLIKLVTPPNGKVLDPFNGSGSTGIAAVNLGYEYVGIELNPKYVEISNKRIEAYNKNTNTFNKLFEEQ